MANVTKWLAKTGPKLVKSTTTFVVPRAQVFWQYARVELKPPSLSDIPQIKQGFINIAEGAQSGRWKTFTVKESVQNTVVALEIVFLFFVGEILGKGNVVGYYIPGAVDYDM